MATQSHAAELPRTRLNPPQSCSTCGRTVFSLVRWTATTYGRRCATSTGTRCERAWPKTRSSTKWSSARAHVEGRDRLGLLDLALWKEVNRGTGWREVLGRTRDEDAAEMAALRRATETGRPLGSEAFVKRLEAAFGRQSMGNGPVVRRRSMLCPPWRKLSACRVETLSTHAPRPTGPAR